MHRVYCFCLFFCFVLGCGQSKQPSHGKSLDPAEDPNLIAVPLKVAAAHPYTFQEGTATANQPGPQQDFEVLDSRFNAQLEVVRAEEVERRRRVEAERQRKITLHTTWLEFLETRREDLKEVFAAKMEAEKLTDLKLEADENKLLITAVALGEEFRPFTVTITELGVETDWKLTRTDLTDSVKAFFQKLLFNPAEEGPRKRR